MKGSRGFCEMLGCCDTAIPGIWSPSLSVSNTHRWGMLDRGWINRIAWHGQQRGIDHRVFVLLEDDVDDDVARIQMLARPIGTI